MNKVFLLLFSIVIFGIAFVVFIIPDYNALQKEKAEVAALEKNIEVIKNLESSREKLTKQQVSISQRDMERLDKIIPPSPDNIRLIIQLDEIAKRNGLTMLKDVSYDAKAASLPVGQEEESQEDYKSYEISFTTTGQYVQFLSFLSEVEKNLRLVDIISVDLKNVEKEEKSPVPLQEFGIRLKAYWLSNTYE